MNDELSYNFYIKKLKKRDVANFTTIFNYDIITSKIYIIITKM